LFPPVCFNAFVDIKEALSSVCICMVSRNWIE
jgi:hypothetical protein